MNWNEIVSNLLVAAITVSIPIILGMLNAWLKPWLARMNEKVEKEIGLAQWKFIKDVVSQFVLAAEQRGVWDDALQKGKDKKTWTLMSINHFLKEYDIDLDVDLIDAAIEEAVFGMKNGH